MSTKGLILSVACGIFMGMFYRFVAAAMYARSRAARAGQDGPLRGRLRVRGRHFPEQLRLEYAGDEEAVRRHAGGFADYFKAGFSTHLTGILGGIIWGVGMSLSLIASGRAGYAISYGLGQGATMVAAFWGVFIWKEFRSAPRGHRQAARRDVRLLSGRSRADRGRAHALTPGRNL